MAGKDCRVTLELSVDQRKLEEPVILREGNLDKANLSAKLEMAKELHCMGLSARAIGRILHLNEEVVRRYVELREMIVKEGRLE